jgi:Xaa-Pro aminopeptidase
MLMLAAIRMSQQVLLSAVIPLRSLSVRFHPSERRDFQPWVSTAWRQALRSHSLLGVDANLVDAVWAHARPVAAPTPALVVPALRAGATVDEKAGCCWNSRAQAGGLSARQVGKARASLAVAGCTALVVCALDEVAWLLNIRGADVPFNPVLHAYVVVTPTSVSLCADAAKLAAVADTLPGVVLRPYEEVLPLLRAVGAEPGARVWVDPARCSIAVHDALAAAGAQGPCLHPWKNRGLTRVLCIVYQKESPLAMLKALKTQAELDGLRAAHVRDAAAQVRFFSWLEDAVRRGDALDEVAVADVLEAERRCGGL